MHAVIAGEYDRFFFLFFFFLYLERIDDRGPSTSEYPLFPVYIIPWIDRSIKKKKKLYDFEIQFKKEKKKKKENTTLISPDDDPNRATITYVNFLYNSRSTVLIVRSKHIDISRTRYIGQAHS